MAPRPESIRAVGKGVVLQEAVQLWRPPILPRGHPCTDSAQSGVLQNFGPTTVRSDITSLLLNHLERPTLT